MMRGKSWREADVCLHNWAASWRYSHGGWRYERLRLVGVERRGCGTYRLSAENRSREHDHIQLTGKKTDSEVPYWRNWFSSISNA